ncbi:MAG: ferritin-like domain-containing protein, partial [Planctomycetota bacterium]
VVELGSPVFAFTLCEKERVWADEAADLYAQGKAAQWDAARDIPWSTLRPLADPVEEAVDQVMTFLAENELSAMYVPARFLPRIHPHFIEVILFLAQQQADEARHYEAFTRRAVANGGSLRYSAATGQLSLKTLVEQEDFPAASFLLSVLGEGTFVDLLRFIEEHAPDDGGVTREIMRRARIDETRHVHFGVAHTRAFLAAHSKNEGELIDATRARAGTLAQVTSPSRPVLDALAVLAAGSLEPSAIRRGVAAVAKLHEVMHENRVKRLVSSGFSSQLAEQLSKLHTHNFM